MAEASFANRADESAAAQRQRARPAHDPSGRDELHGSLHVAAIVRHAKRGRRQVCPVQRGPSCSIGWWRPRVQCRYCAPGAGVGKAYAKGYAPKNRDYIESVPSRPKTRRKAAGDIQHRAAAMFAQLHGPGSNPFTGASSGFPSVFMPCRQTTSLPDRQVTGHAPLKAGTRAPRARTHAGRRRCRRARSAAPRSAG